MKKYYFSLLGISLLAVINLLLSRMVSGYSDWYTDNIFPFWGKTYGYIPGKLSFSVGEILLYAAVLYLAVSLLLYLVRIVLKICQKKALKRFTAINTRILALLFTLILVVQINNCFVLYQTAKIFDGCKIDCYVPTRDNLIELERSLAATANSLYTTFDRNEKGEIINVSDQEVVAVAAMNNLGNLAKKRSEEGGENKAFYDRLTRLWGKYSSPKPLKTSAFFSQQGILGYYFPFSLEANYNNMMYIANYPSTFCHELSHLKGFIREDEANFVSYLACMNSKDPFMQYSAVLNLLAYMFGEIEDDPGLRAEFAGIYPRVAKDMAFLTEEAWEKVEENAILDTETVSRASNEFLDKNLTLNGVEEGIASYSGVIELALKFYFGRDDK